MLPQRRSADRSESPARRGASSATSSNAGRSRMESLQPDATRRGRSRSNQLELHGGLVPAALPKRREGGMAHVSFQGSAPPVAHHDPKPRLERSSVESAGARLEASHMRSTSGRPKEAPNPARLRQAESDTEGREAAVKRSRSRMQSRSAFLQSVASAPFRKGVNAKQLTTWVRVWPSGDSALLQTEKATLTSTLGIQPRDFRIMDSQATRQACCILCRDKCIIISMSYVRCVITSTCILLTPPEDDRSSVFLGKLKERVRQSQTAPGRLLFGKRSIRRAASPAALAFAAASSSVGGGPGGGSSSSGGGGPPNSSSASTLQQNLHPRRQWSLRHLGPSQSASSGPLLAAASFAARGRQLSAQMPGLQPPQAASQPQMQQPALQPDAVHLDDDDGVHAIEMPFELRAMEICLDELANDIEQGTKELEHSLKPAIEGLAKSVRSENLDLLRRLKTRLVNLKTMTQAVCVSLEELLEDDDDMANMSLTAKAQRELDLLQRVSFAISEDSEEGNLSDSSVSSDHSVKVSQVEMLLETYFMHFDSIFDRLQDLMENVTDTEAVVNIKLDAHQNKLITVNVMCQALGVINYFSLGIFGFFTMNIVPPYPLNMHWGGPDDVPGGSGGSQGTFMSVLLPAILGAYLIFLVLLVYLNRRGVLSF